MSIKTFDTALRSVEGKIFYGFLFISSFNSMLNLDDFMLTLIKHEKKL